MGWHLGSCGYGGLKEDAPVTEMCAPDCPKRLHARIEALEAALREAGTVIARPDLDHLAERMLARIDDLLDGKDG